MRCPFATSAAAPAPVEVDVAEDVNGVQVDDGVLVAEAVAAVGAPPHETPAGKSVEYASPPAPVTTAPVPLASSRRVAGLVAGRKRTVPGTAVNGAVAGVKSALRKGGKATRREIGLAALGPCSRLATHVYRAVPFTTRKSAMRPLHL